MSSIPNNGTAYAPQSDAGLVEEMESYDRLPAPLRRAYANSNHDWSTIDVEIDFKADKGWSMYDQSFQVRKDDAYENELHEWGLDKGFPDKWQKRASCAVMAKQFREKKGLRTFR